MITETLLAAALAFTGGAVINENPQNVHEGISGCAAYEQPLEQRACVGRVHYAWTGQKAGMEAAEAPVSVYQAPQVPKPAPVVPGPSQGIYSPGAVAPINTNQPVPVVDGNATTGDDGEWIEPEWCELTKSADYSGPVDHASGDDWSIVTESWEDWQVERCF